MDKRKSYKVVYTIVQRPRDGRKFWLRIGAAFENQDGSWNVYMDALPTNGQLQIRDFRPTDRAAANDNDSFELAPDTALAS